MSGAGHEKRRGPEKGLQSGAAVSGGGAWRGAFPGDRTPAAPRSSVLLCPSSGDQLLSLGESGDGSGPRPFMAELLRYTVGPHLIHLRVSP